jgi:hypothetical protein
VLELKWEDVSIPTTIFISGKKRHGKDLFAGQIRTQLIKLDQGRFVREDEDAETDSYRVSGIRISRIAFADPIKQFAKLAFGLDEDQVNGSTKHKESPIPFWNGLTPREIMQQIGSNLRMIDEDVFAKSLIERMKQRREKHLYNDRMRGHRRRPNHIFINSDCRYPNEVEIARQNLSNAVFIRIVRPGKESTGFDDHPSETALDNYNGWDHVVINDMDIPGLRAKAAKLVASWAGIDANSYANLTI